MKSCSGKANQARLDCFFKAGAAKTSTSGVNSKPKGGPAAGAKKSMPMMKSGASQGKK